MCRRRQANQRIIRALANAHIEEVPQAGDPPQEERDHQELNNVPDDREDNDAQRLLPLHAEELQQSGSIYHSFS